MVTALSPAKLAEWLQNASRTRPVLLDVREPWECALAQLPGSVNVPMGELASRLASLDPDCETVVICHHGMRSAHAALYLQQAGFETVFNLSGGIDAWSQQVDPSLCRY